MRNDPETKIERIMILARKLPCFELHDLFGIEKDKNYLRVLFYRYKKTGKIITLKKGWYTTKDYLDKITKNNQLGDYSEFVSIVLYEPSYLSLEYVLYENNILTEIPVNLSLISKKKTQHFSNQFGSFFYHKIKKELFCGFTIIKKGEFTIYKATKAKALFDFLYLRKNSIASKSAAEELRLNLDNFNTTDKKELERYIKMTGSKKMMTIFDYLFA